MKKIIIVIFSIMVLFAFGSNIAMAKTTEVENVCNGEEYGKIMYPDPLYYKDVKVAQLCVYKNRNAAFKNFENIHRKFIDKYNIIINSKMNAEQLREEFYNKVYSKDPSKIESDKYREITLFIDIWSGYDYNNEYKRIIDEANLAPIKNRTINTTVLEKETFEQLYLISGESDNEQLKLKVDQNTNPKARATYGLNVTNAVNYASKYAVYPNGNMYTKYGYSYYDGKDCTNFASQILVAGGIKQSIYSSSSSGWWHKKVFSNYLPYSGTAIYKSSSSISWINANTFSKYMGRKSYSNYRSLASAVGKGDFIGFDEGKNGTVDHVAFITSKNSSGKLKIAQHTPNYHKWEHETGWPNLSVYKYTFYKIR